MRTAAPPGDPVIALNKVTFGHPGGGPRGDRACGQGLQEYSHPIRAGLRHFFTNLTEPVVALNFLLQLKPGKAAETLGRFALNSTVGIGGLLDVAVAKPSSCPIAATALPIPWPITASGRGRSCSCRWSARRPCAT
jgi:phospholipid-binding lipoprotein MlaA